MRRSIASASDSGSHRGKSSGWLSWVVITMSLSAARSMAARAATAAGTARKWGSQVAWQAGFRARSHHNTAHTRIVAFP